MSFWFQELQQSKKKKAKTYVTKKRKDESEIVEEREETKETERGKKRREERDERKTTRSIQAKSRLRETKESGHVHTYTPDLLSLDFTDIASIEDYLGAYLSSSVL